MDYIVIFDEDTPYDFIKIIQPDILVKDDEYKAEDVVGKDIVGAKGGRLQLPHRMQGVSTTNLMNKIRS